MTDRTERTHCEWDGWENIPCHMDAKFRYDGQALCEFHYGPTNARLGINKPDEVVP